MENTVENGVVMRYDSEPHMWYLYEERRIDATHKQCYRLWEDNKGYTWVESYKNYSSDPTLPLWGWGGYCGPWNRI